MWDHIMGPNKYYYGFIKRPIMWAYIKCLFKKILFNYLNIYINPLMWAINRAHNMGGPLGP